MADDNRNIMEKAKDVIEAGVAKTMAFGKETDQSALQKLHEINLAEIQVGRLGEERGMSALAREYGARLVQDHEALDKRVMDVARDQRIDLSPSALTDGAKGLREKLHSIKSNIEQSKAADFDQTFADQMVKGHEKATAIAKHAVDDVKSDEVKNLLRTTIPALEEHLRQAEQLQGLRH